MKILGIDKNKGKKLKCGFVALLTGFSAILTGCAQSVNASSVDSVEETIAPTSEPVVVSVTPAPTMEPTAEPTPEPTPIPTPEPTATPEPTPFVRTSFEIPDDEYIEEAMAKLGIIDDNRRYFDYEFGCVMFTDRFGQVRYIQIDLPELTKGKKNYSIVDAHSGMELFSFNSSDCVVNPKSTMENQEHYFDAFYNFERFTPKSEIFEGVDPSSIRISKSWFWWFYESTALYVSHDEYLSIHTNSIMNGKKGHEYNTGMFKRTREEIGRFYATYCLPENFVSAADINPSLYAENDGPTFGK